MVVRVPHGRVLFDDLGLAGLLQHFQVVVSRRLLSNAKVAHRLPAVLARAKRRVLKSNVRVGRLPSVIGPAHLPHVPH